MSVITDLAPASDRATGEGPPASTATADYPLPGPEKAGNGEGILGLLDRSQLCQDFRQAFLATTGFPVALQPAGSWRLPLHGGKRGSPFCALMAERSRTCVACLQSHDRLWEEARSGAAMRVCAYGLWELAVPVRAGTEVIGCLHTGQAFQHPPTQKRFERVGQRLARNAPELMPPR